VVPFNGTQLEHEIGGKTLSVALDGLYQDSGLDVVERSQVSAQHDFAPAQKQDRPVDAFGGDELF
jgi:hypothetical protein